jgi:hypothetical protein
MQILEKIAGAIVIIGAAYVFVTMIAMAIMIVIKNTI